MTTGKTRPLTRLTFADRIISLTFKYAVYVGHSFSSKKQVSFNFMATVNICSDCGAPQNSLLLFPLFPHLFDMK